MRSLIGFLILLCAINGQKASASSLFYDKCEQQSSLVPASDLPIVLVANSSGFAGMSCQDLKSAFDAAQIISMTLMPVTLALKTPGVRELISADMAAAGLTLANPAVLGVTVLGAVGFVTIYFVMKQSLDDCERSDREQFKQELIQQLKQSYPASKGSTNVPLEIRKDGRAA